MLENLGKTHNVCGASQITIRWPAMVGNGKVTVAITLAADSGSGSVPSSDGDGAGHAHERCTQRSRDQDWVGGMHIYDLGISLTASLPLSLLSLEGRGHGLLLGLDQRPKWGMMSRADAASDL